MLRRTTTSANAASSEDLRRSSSGSPWATLERRELQIFYAASMAACSYSRARPRRLAWHYPCWAISNGLRISRPLTTLEDYRPRPASCMRCCESARTGLMNEESLKHSPLLDVALGTGTGDELGLLRARTERTQSLPRVGNPTKQGLDHQEARLVIGSRQVTTKRLGTAVRQEDA